MDDKAVRSARRNKFAAAVLFSLAVPIQAYGWFTQGRISFLWIALTIVAVSTYVKCDRIIRTDQAQTSRTPPVPEPPASYDFFGGSS